MQQHVGCTTYRYLVPPALCHTTRYHRYHVTFPVFRTLTPHPQSLSGQIPYHLFLRSAAGTLTYVHSSTYRYNIRVGSNCSYALTPAKLPPSSVTFQRRRLLVRCESGGNTRTMFLEVTLSTCCPIRGVKTDVFRRSRTAPTCRERGGGTKPRGNCVR